MPNMPIVSVSKNPAALLNMCEPLKAKNRPAKIAAPRPHKSLAKTYNTIHVTVPNIIGKITVSSRTEI